MVTGKRVPGYTYYRMWISYDDVVSAGWLNQAPGVSRADHRATVAAMCADAYPRCKLFDGSGNMYGWDDAKPITDVLMPLWDDAETTMGVWVSELEPTYNPEGRWPQLAGQLDGGWIGGCMGGCLAG